MKNETIVDEPEEVTSEPEVSSNGSAPVKEQFISIPIEGLEHYQISALAHVRNAKGQLLTPYQPGGKPNVTPWVTMNSKANRLDKLVLGSFVGPPKSWRYGPRHLDGDPANCVLDNLEWEYGLGRKPQIHAPQKRTRKAATTSKKSPKPKAAATVDVHERIFLESGNITVMWNRTERKVDVSQLPNSSPVIDEVDIPSLIRILQHIVAG